MAGNRIGDGTAAGLSEYLDVLVEKGRATDGAIRPLKTAFVKVMKTVDGESWQNVKVDTVDVNDHVSRFSVLTRGTYNPRSLSVYRARMQRVVDWYNRFMSPEEAGYMPQIDTRAPRTPKPEVAPEAQQALVPVPESLPASVAPGQEEGGQGESGARPAAKAPAAPPTAVQPAAPSVSARTAAMPAIAPVAAAGDANLIDYPFPMADGTIAVLRLPATVSANDAARMSRFISTLVIDDSAA